MAPIGYDGTAATQSSLSIRPRKSSGQVVLVLLGAATLVACGQDDETMRRDVYANRDDCVADWGDEVKCEQSLAAPQGHAVFWYGPVYRSGRFGSSRNSDPPGTIGGARPGSHAIATSHVSRGGFGATGAAHGFGGS